MAELVLIRGLPGSGKSTMARTLALIGFDHFEADMYFEQDGEYRFDALRLKQAHEWCQKSAREALERGRRVVVSNTFTQLWEMEPYLEMGRELAGGTTMVVARGPWQSIRGVPDEKVQQMRERWEEVEACDESSALP